MGINATAAPALKQSIQQAAQQPQAGQLVEFAEKTRPVELPQSGMTLQGLNQIASTTGGPSVGAFGNPIPASGGGLTAKGGQPPSPQQLGQGLQQQAAMQRLSPMQQQANQTRLNEFRQNMAKQPAARPQQPMNIRRRY